MFIRQGIVWCLLQGTSHVPSRRWGNREREKKKELSDLQEPDRSWKGRKSLSWWYWFLPVVGMGTWWSPCDTDSHTPAPAPAACYTAVITFPPGGIRGAAVVCQAGRQGEGCVQLRPRLQLTALVAPEKTSIVDRSVRTHSTMSNVSVDHCTEL